MERLWRNFSVHSLFIRLLSIWVIHQSFKRLWNMLHHTGNISRRHMCTHGCKTSGRHVASEIKYFTVELSPKYGTCFLSFFRCLEFWGYFKSSWKMFACLHKHIHSKTTETWVKTNWSWEIKDTHIKLSHWSLCLFYLRTLLEKRTRILDAVL